MSSLDAYFADDSPLASVLEGFVPRQGQALMAGVVAEAIDTAEHLVVEAGTGTGKTFAYLLPALLCGKKTIISTGTKALQDQLYHRDLPTVAKAVGRPVETALLKGRANYLCLHRLEQVTEPASELLDDYHAISAWRHRTLTGDRAELTEVPEDAPVWPLVTSTADNCLGQKCDFYNECHVVRARRAAQEAELVVVNHHLLLADLAMKEEGFVEFLPGADAVILDEAHQVPDLAVQFFGVGVGTRELDRLVDEVRAAVLPFGQAELLRRVDAVDTAIRMLRAEAPRDEGRHELDDVIHRLREPLDRLGASVTDLVEALAGMADAADAIEKLVEQLMVVAEKLAVIGEESAWDGLRWLEVNPRSLRLNLTPLDVSQKMAALMSQGHQAWIMTSATLAVGEDFSHFTSRLGLGDARCLAFPSPFDLANNGLVYLPRGLPAPSDRDHTASVLESLVPLLDMTPGGVFCLFTSHRALNNARYWFRQHRSVLGKRKLLVQGSAPRDDLTRRFRAAGNAVLLGTGSFWEGIDVRGEALSIVLIDKLPFASPGDPLTMARLEFIRREGGNGFMQHQVPQAVLALKQGAGRLLRSETDFGVIILGDPRITAKRYGKLFLDSLLPMPVTAMLDDVEAFFARRKQAVA